MERFCASCGAFVTGTASHCPNCGAVMGGAVNLGKEQQFQNMQGTQNNFVQPSESQPAEQMTVGQWVGTIVITTCFSLISLLVTIIWAFAPTTPEPKKSFCKAWLIVMLVLIVLGIIFTVIMAVFIGPELAKYEFWREVIKAAPV